MSERTCAVTGNTDSGKHYVLKTTEGEEFVSPLVFAAVGTLVSEVSEIREALRDLEDCYVELKVQYESLTSGNEKTSGDVDEHQDVAEVEAKEPEGDRIQAAAKKAAAPVKKAPAQRKATD